MTSIQKNIRKKTHLASRGGRGRRSGGWSSQESGLRGQANDPPTLNQASPATALDISAPTICLAIALSICKKKKNLQERRESVFLHSNWRALQAALAKIDSTQSKHLHGSGGRRCFGDPLRPLEVAARLVRIKRALRLVASSDVFGRCGQESASPIARRLEEGKAQRGAHFCQ